MATPWLPLLPLPNVGMTTPLVESLKSPYGLDTIDGLRFTLRLTFERTSNEPVTVRRLRSSDIPEVTALLSTSLLTRPSSTFVRQHLHQNSRLCLIAQSNRTSRILATITGYRIPNLGSAYVSSLCTCTSFRRSGLASKLLNHFIQTWSSEPLRQISLHVLPSNAIARTFYRNRGFIESVIVRDFYRVLTSHRLGKLVSNPDALLMIKQL